MRFAYIFVGEEGHYPLLKNCVMNDTDQPSTSSYSDPLVNYPLE